MIDFIKNNTNIQIKEEKLKPLIPTLRTKKRILRVKIISDKKLDFNKVVNSTTNHLINILGVIELGKSGTWFIKERFDYKNQILLIKVSTKHKEKVVGALSLLTHIEKQPVRLKIEKVSGTVKGALQD